MWHKLWPPNSLREIERSLEERRATVDDDERFRQRQLFREEQERRLRALQAQADVIRRRQRGPG